MRYRALGKTGLQVSEVALGTVELGMDYGFRGSDHYQRPEPKESIRLLHRAFELGINLIDTARSYGSSEELIGKAFAGIPNRPLVASKFIVPSELPLDRKKLGVEIISSIDTSLKALRVESIDLLQIHNATLENLRIEEIFQHLEQARRQGKIRFIGASGDGEAACLEALTNESIQTVQAAFNLLNQKLRRRAFGAAFRRGVGVLLRSAYLRGVLTRRLDEIPQRLSPLRDSAIGALMSAGTEVATLPELALRFCLSFPVSSVIIGVRTVEELETNLADANKGAFPAELLENLRKFAVEDESLVNPIHWQDLI